MIFVDSGAWFASLIPTDPDHSAVSAWLQQNRQPLLTTDYVFDETLTLLVARGQTSRAIAFGSAEAWDIFRHYLDKDWSFTDCTCKAVIDRLGITAALSFDQHFRQFGTVTVVP